MCTSVCVCLCECVYVCALVASLCAPTLPQMKNKHMQSSMRECWSGECWRMHIELGMCVCVRGSAHEVISENRYPPLGGCAVCWTMHSDMHPMCPFAPGAFNSFSYICKYYYYSV